MVSAPRYGGFWSKSVDLKTLTEELIKEDKFKHPGTSISIPTLKKLDGDIP